MTRRRKSDPDWRKRNRPFETLVPTTGLPEEEEEEEEETVEVV